MGNTDTIYDDGFAFEFAPAAENRSLRSVAINSDGVQELRFDNSPHTPSLSEEDVALIFRVVSKGERPDFTYRGLDELHPFYGRQYMQYNPSWLKGTSVGEVLSEADWKMKCLNIGVQTDKTKSVFYSREKTSVTRGLATYLEFDRDNSDSHDYIHLRCRGVSVQKYEDELVFCDDPKLYVDYYKSKAYSEYISRVLPQIAEHDEPVFLKLQELIKVVLAAEWLRDKEVVMSKKWMKHHCSDEKKTEIAVSRPDSVRDHSLLVSEVKNSISRVQQTVDISMNESERQHSEQVIREDTAVYYGWYDSGSGEMVQYREDGEWHKEIRSLRTCHDVKVTINGREVNAGVMLINFGIQLPNGKMRVQDLLKLENDLKAVKEHDEWSDIFGSFSIDITADHVEGKEDCEVHLTAVMKAHRCFLSEENPEIKIEATVRESASDLNFVYKSLDLQKPIKDILGAPIVHQQQSWNEFYSETVPWPRVWLSSPDGSGVLSATGGVRTDVIPTTEEKLRDGTRKTRMEYSHLVTARTQGRLQVANPQETEFVTDLFRQTWKELKGRCPPISSVLRIDNNGLQQKFQWYRDCLQDKTKEWHFHGTPLNCDKTKNLQLCLTPDCGICGISNEGFSPSFINDARFQRFGKGFYLAPNSSKSNDYAKEFTSTSDGVPHKYKAQLLCDVCPGNKYILKENNQSLQGPPSGCDSVYGQLVGEDLNYPEIVLYNSAAILPRYVVIYNVV